MERLLLGAFGICFGGVGLAVNAFVWGQSTDAFGAMPLFFRVFFSLITIPFIAFGFTAMKAALAGGSPSSLTAQLRGRAEKLLDDAGQGAERGEPQDIANRGRTHYACPQCAAPLGDEADISPSGDVKCVYCRTWYNVRHG